MAVTVDAPLVEAKRVASRRLLDAASKRIPCEPIRELLPEGTARDGYDIQALVTAEALAQGRRIVGRKIGLTSPAVQAQLGVDQPDFGTLFADMALCDGETVPIDRLLQPRVEAEVAFVLGSDLSRPDVTPVEVIRATEFVLPAIEIVDSRVIDWDITIVDTVADNASSGLFVTGARGIPLTSVDLAGISMELRNGHGSVISSGTGRACLGHPVISVAWLARTLAELGEPLSAGDTVLSGALGPMVPAAPGSAFEAVIDGLGTVRLTFASSSDL